MARTAVHIIDPDRFVREGVDRPWCGTFGARYSPMVEHPDNADCVKCLRRYEAWEASGGE